MDYSYVLAHGLNQRPEAMRRWAEHLKWPADRGTLIRLPGHGGTESLRQVTAARWLTSFREQYVAAAGETSLVYVGYSLSGLLMTHLLSTQRIPQPTKQILLAPALAFRRWTRLPVLFPPQWDRWLIPSFAPARYKANPGVTINAYKAMFSIRQELEAQPAAHYNVPTLVLCDQHDEMVDPEGLRTFIRDKNLSQWQLHILPSSPWRRWGKKHLLTAPEYHTNVYRETIKSYVARFLTE